PAATLVPVSVHTGAPDEQAIDPTWQGFVGVQLAPAAHATHAIDALQTIPVPHDAPTERAVPVSLHTGAPVEQTVVPAWHGLVGVHGAPAMQAVQVAVALHTIPEPHDE